MHAHQPVGNFGWVFEDAYEKSYKPFFDTLAKHPSIPVSCHFSGSLLDWLVQKKPDFIELLKKMSKRGQLEFLGGGYYEPIYGAIPKRDLAGQIEMMRGKLKTILDAEPRGAWLTERVWDPDLVRPLKKAGVEYTILDDLHLEKAGLGSPVTGYYWAKEGKDTLDLFASMKQLRYLMPFGKAEEAIEFILSSRSGPEDAMVFADDCEKFGMWPGTYQWVYVEKWLDQFLTLLEEENGKIKVYTFSQFKDRFKAKRAVRIPHASYSEMMEWSGGHFYNFFKKYPESRYMRDRMWHVSDLLEKSRSKNGTSAAWGRAKEALYRAQCNCTYWHGVFGGLYLHHLRSAVFENLIQAEDLLVHHGKKSPVKGAGRIQVEKLQSGERWQLRQKNLVSFFNPEYGAALEELDYIPKSVNLMCNLQRHKESYHEVVLKKVSTAAEGQPLSIHQMLGSKEKNLEELLHYDVARRLSFMDHFFEEEVTLDDFSKSAYAEAGNFIGRPYRPRVKKADGLREFSFEKEGALRLGKKRRPLSLVKTIGPAGGSALRARYRITNPGAKALRFVFGVEFNFSIGENTAMKGLREKNVREWVLNDSWRGVAIKLQTSKEAVLLAAPVETVSESESGLEKTYQELAVLLQRPFTLEPKETQEVVIELGVS
ncbi:MAG: alpha-amylase/4-alpha-glucanotransferase domain-containing protein [Candidatus Omnitrophota bacterium]